MSNKRLYTTDWALTTHDESGLKNNATFLHSFPNVVNVHLCERVALVFEIAVTSRHENTPLMLLESRARRHCIPRFKSYYFVVILGPPTPKWPPRTLVITHPHLTFLVSTYYAHRRSLVTVTAPRSTSCVWPTHDSYYHTRYIRCSHTIGNVWWIHLLRFERVLRSLNTAREHSPTE